MTFFQRLACSGLIVGGSACANHWHENSDDWKWHWEHELADQGLNHHHAKGCYFEPHDLRLIRAYYLQGHTASPPAASKIRRNGDLPRGWEGRMELFPPLVDRLLVTLPEGYRRGFIDGFVVVYNLQSGAVLDSAPLN